MVQGIGSIVNIAWISQGGVTNNSLCVAQGAIKQTGNVGTALWSLVIAIHTFALLFYRAKIPNWACYVTLVVVWLILGTVLSLGPGILQTEEKGPFYGISGLWCWMTTGYLTEKYALEYGWMFFSAGCSFILYSLVFLRLRGNIVVNGWRFNFQRRIVAKGYSNRQYNAVTDPSQNTHVMKVARQMMWYPVVYTILIVPIAGARFAVFAGKTVPNAVTVFTATVFMLSGFVNAILFTTTRRVVPASMIFPRFIRDRFGISTGTGMATHRSFTNQNGTTITSRVSKAFPNLNGGIGITVNIEKEMEYDLESPSKGSYPMTQRTIRPFDPVSPFNQQSLGSPTAVGRKIVWDDHQGHSPSTSSRKRASSLGSTNSGGDDAKGGPDLPAPALYPSPPRQYQLNQLTYQQQPSHNPNVATYLNSRDRGDRGLSMAYGYAGQDYVSPQDGYDSHTGRAL
jgi:hypothetical protein